MAPLSLFPSDCIGYAYGAVTSQTEVCGKRIYAIQYETKRDFSKSLHSKQNKRLATATALNTNETSTYTYELLLTSADIDCFSQRVFLYTVFCWRLNTHTHTHTYLFLLHCGDSMTRRLHVGTSISKYNKAIILSQKCQENF